MFPFKHDDLPLNQPPVDVSASGAGNATAASAPAAAAPAPSVGTPSAMLDATVVAALGAAPSARVWPTDAQDDTGWDVALLLDNREVRAFSLSAHIVRAFSLSETHHTSEKVALRILY